MKKILTAIILGLFIGSLGAKEKEDPVVMTVAGKDIPLSEFLFLARKDTTVNLLDKKSLANWVELFTNFKLKVADAESLRIQESMGFSDELDSYKAQLRASYLSDKEGEAEVMHKVYERGNDIVSVSHIVFLFNKDKVTSKDTVPVYNEANKAYQRILAGEDFEKVAQELAADSAAVFEKVDYVFPLQALKSFEDAVFSLQEVGEITAPVRTDMGFHIIRLDRRFPNPGLLKVAHILVMPEEDPLDPHENDDTTLYRKATELYQRAKNGEDFGYLALMESSDRKTGNERGVLPYFGLGEMVKPFEQAAFALKDTGDITEPIKTRYGYHIIKLLDRKPRPPFEEMESSIHQVMEKGERNFELFKSFEDKEKEKFHYVFYPDAYADFQKLCDDYHPSGKDFIEQAAPLEKPLLILNDTMFYQHEFTEYLRRFPFSTKVYAGDFLYDIYRLFVRDILTAYEKFNLSAMHPEYDQLVKEYYDGILLFDISSRRVWDKPVEEQEQLEAEWMKEIKEKYPVTINQKVLKNLKKYIKKMDK